MKNYLILAIVMIAMSLNGCALLQDETQGKLIVQLAIVETIAMEDSTRDQMELASDIYEISNEFKTFFDDQRLPIIEIKSLLYEKVDYIGLPFNKKLRVDIIVNSIESYIGRQGNLGEDVYVTGSQVLGWAMDAARLAGAR